MAYNLVLYLGPVVTKQDTLNCLIVLNSQTILPILDRITNTHQDPNMPSYQVTIKTPDKDYTFSCDSDTYILDEAEENGLDLPYSCRAGACSSCAGKIVSGTVNQNDQSYLDDDQIEEGYVLLCIGKPTSDCVIKSHQEDNLDG